MQYAAAKRMSHHPRQWLRNGPGQIVLDIPEDADAIAFGVLLEGPGRVWLDDLQFKHAADDTPTTAKNDRVLPPAPVNPDFEQTDRA